MAIHPPSHRRPSLANEKNSAYMRKIHVYVSENRSKKWISITVSSTLTACICTLHAEIGIGPHGPVKEKVGCEYEFCCAMDLRLHRGRMGYESVSARVNAEISGSQQCGLFYRECFKTEKSFLTIFIFIKIAHEILKHSYK
jgi:hypothetical protein